LQDRQNLNENTGITRRDEMTKTTKELNRILDEIQAKNRALQAEKNESRVPEVGIVYLIGEDLFMDGVPAKDAEDYGEFKIYDRDHFSWFENELAYIHSISSIVKGKEYENFPRGRVSYSKLEDMYYILLDRCIIKNKDDIKEIIKMFHIPYNKYVIKKDNHYVCPKCS